MTRLLALVAALVLCTAALVAFSTRDLTEGTRGGMEPQIAPDAQPVPYQEGTP